MLCTFFGLRIGLVVWKGRFLNLVNVFMLFHYYFILGKGLAHHCDRMNPPGCFVPHLLSSSSGYIIKRRVFNCCQCVFVVLQSYPFGKLRSHSFNQTWIHPKLFLNNLSVLSIFCYNIPLNKCVTLNMNKLESLPLKNA